jgi:hypothetical protein
MYEPLKVFTYIGLVVFGSGFAVSLRYVYFYFTQSPIDRSGHLQSLIASAVLMIVGFVVLVIGLLADVNAGNRKLIEDLLYRVRMMELRQREDQPDEPRPALTTKDRWDR